MSLHYLLDGYNIIHQISQLIPKTLEAQRNWLVHYIESNNFVGSKRNTITIVFDGKPGVYGSLESSSIKVIFSKGGSADDKIKSIVEDAKQKKTFVVVTDDRAIQYAVRANGAKVLSVKEFLSKGPLSKSTAKTKRGKPTKSGKGKNISKTLEHEITSEFEKIWLKKKD